MGYTHYWRQLRDFTDTEWQELTRLTNLIIADNKGILSDGFGEGGKPEVNGQHIWFNGLGEDSHETFRITKKKRPKADYEEQEALRREWQRNNYPEEFEKSERLAKMILKSPIYSNRFEK